MMHRLRVLAASEWATLWRDRTAVAVVLVLTCALAVAGATGRARADAAQADAADARQLAEASHREIVAAAAGAASGDTDLPTWGVRHPDFVANDRGTWAPIPPAPLVTLAVGQTDLYPAAVKITASRHEGALAGAALTHPLALGIGSFDVLFVIVYLLPLAMTIAVSDLVTAERERGTLSLLLAQGATPWELLAGKLLPRAALVLAPAVAIPTLLLATADGAADTGRLALWLCITTAYAVFWLGLAIVVSVRARSSAGAALVMAGAWLLLVVVVPGVIGLVLNAAAITPSGVQLADATRAATREALSDGSRVLGHFLEDHPTASAVGRDGLRQYALLQAARDQEVARRLRPLLDDWEAALGRQRAMAGWLQFLSPPVLAATALSEAAGTGEGRQQHANAQVQHFRQQWRDYFMPLIFDAAPITAAAAAGMPRFDLVDEPVRVAGGRVLLPALVMLFAGLGFVVAGGRRFARAPFGVERTS